MQALTRQTPIRVMYWPNEPTGDPSSQQRGGRLAFEAMLYDGTISAYEVFSYRVERVKHQGVAAFEEAALEATLSFQPDIIFVQHLYGTDLRSSFWIKMRSCLPKMTLVYHEGDPFDRAVKRVDRATIGALQQAHLIFTCGLGSLANIARHYGNAPVRHMPHCFDAERFGVKDPSAALKSHDLLMIGNKGTRRRLKFSYLPGGRRRAELATRLSGEFGLRFALYGNGWSHLSSALGRLPFDRQEEAIQSARVSVNWDHFDTISHYFSDRLPISLAAGVPHVTTYHCGFDDLFGTCPGLYTCRSVEEAVDTCRWLLSRPDEELLSEGLAARHWAYAHLEAKGVFKRAIQIAVTEHDRRIA